MFNWEVCCRFLLPICWVPSSYQTHSSNWQLSLSAYLSFTPRATTLLTLSLPLLPGPLQSVRAKYEQWQCIFPQIKPISRNILQQRRGKILYRGYRIMKFSFFFLIQFFFTPTSKSPPVRRNMCVIVSPSACFIVHTTTSEELPLISRVSESPQHRHLLPAAFLNAFLLRAVLCPCDSGSLSTSSFIIPMGINGLYSLAIHTKGFVIQRKWKQPKWEWESEEFARRPNRPEHSSHE